MLHKKYVSTSRDQGLYRSRAKMSEPLLTKISTTLACTGPRTVIQAWFSGTSFLDASISGCHKFQDCSQNLEVSIYDLSNPCGKLHLIPSVCLNRHLHLSWSDLRFATPSKHHILLTQLLPQQHAKVWPSATKKERKRKHAEPITLAIIPCFITPSSSVVAPSPSLSCSLLSLSFSLSFVSIHSNCTGPTQPFKLVFPLA